MKLDSPVIIRKRDGSAETFSQPKLKRGLAAALAACHYDPSLSEPLARAVELHLRQWQETSPPSSDYIYRCLRAALTQTGMEDAADALTRHRRDRQAERRRVRVFDARRSDSRVSRWRKAEVVRTLVEKHELGPATARILAGEVEAKVLRLQCRALSRSLIAELVMNELSAWGFGDGTVVNHREPGLGHVRNLRPAKEDESIWP